MSESTPYKITYSNWLEFESRTLAFRNKELFDITNTPTHIPFVGHWNVNRKQLSVQKAKELVKHENKIVDVSGLQWYEQEKCNWVFNLKQPPLETDSVSTLLHVV
jgi:hypothetical protein